MELKDQCLCDTIQDPTQYLELLKLKYLERTANLRQQQMELESKIFQMQNFLQSSDNPADTKCQCGAEEIPREFPKYTDAPERDVPKAAADGKPQVMSCSFFQKMMDNAKSILSIKYSYPTASVTNEETLSSTLVSATKNTAELDINLTDKSSSIFCEESEESAAQELSCVCPKTTTTTGTSCICDRSVQQVLTSRKIQTNIGKVKASVQTSTSAAIAGTSISKDVATSKVITRSDDVVKLCKCDSSIVDDQRLTLDNFYVEEEARANLAIQTSYQSHSKAVSPHQTYRCEDKSVSCEYLKCGTNMTVQTSDFRQKNRDNQCSLIGSPELEYLPKSSEKICASKAYPLKSEDVHHIQEISELVKNEQNLQAHVEELKMKQQTYETRYKTMENLKPEMCCPCGVNQKELETEVMRISHDLRLENSALKSELMNMKLELKHCLEKVEGPMKQKLLTEKMRCEQLQQDLHTASKNLLLNQDVYLREMNALKLQLCCANSNITELNQINQRLKSEMTQLDSVCAKLEDDLIKQKINEADTIKLLTRRKYGVDLPTQESDEFKCDSSLAVIARKLSKTLKESAPCKECSNLPAELAGAAKCIKDLTDLVLTRKPPKTRPKAMAKEESDVCCCELHEDEEVVLSTTAPQTEKEVRTLLSVPQSFIQKDGSSREMTTLETKEATEPSRDEFSKYSTTDRSDVDRVTYPCSHIGLPCKTRSVEHDTITDIEVPSKLIKLQPIESQPKINIPCEAIDMSCRENLKGESHIVCTAVCSQIIKPTRVEQEISVDLKPEMRNEFSATSPSREKDLMTPSVRKDIEKIPHQIIDRLPEGIRKDITTPPPSMRKIASSEFAADEQPKLWTSTPKRSMNDISEAVIVEPSIPTEEKEIRKLELAKTGEEKQVPKLQREVAKPTEVLKDIQFTKPRSMEVQETQETLEPIIEAQIEFKETSSPKHLSKAKETGALEETQPSQLSKQLFEEERAGSLPFSVTNEIQVLEEPPSGLHMTTTITGSGTLEVTTEGPAGTIETTLTYTEDGNVEVVTEMVQFADSTKSPISLPLESLLSTHPEVADPETKLKPIVPIISSLISGPSAQDTPFSSSELTSELTSQITSGMEEVIPIVKDSKEMISPPRDLEPETIASLQLVTTEEVPSSVLSEKEGSNGPIRTDSFKISGDELVESPKEMKEKVGSKEPISSDSLRISEDDKVDSPSEKGIIKPTIETVIRDEMLEFGAPVSTELDVTASNKVADKKVTLDVEDQVFEVRKHAAPDAPTVAPEAEETSKPTVKSHGVDCGCQSKDEKEQSCQCCECKEIGITTSGDKETITETDEMCKMVEETGEKDDSDSDFMTLSETNEIAEDQDFGKKTGDTVEEISNLPSDQAETQHKTDPILIAKYPEFVGKTAEEQRSVLIALGYEQPLIDRMMSQPSKESPKLTGETVAKDSVGPVLTEKIIAQDEIPKEEPARKQELPHVSAAEMAFVYDRPKSIEVPEEQGMIVATSQHPVPGVQQLQDFGNVEDKVVLPISQDPLEFVTGWYKPEKALAAKPGVHGKMVEEQNVEREMVAQQIPVELAIQPTKLTPPQQLEAKIRPVTSYPPEQLHRSKERATPSAEQYIKIDELPISTSQEPRDSPPAKASLRADDDFVEKIISIVDESSFLVEEPQKVRSTSDSCKAICSSIRTSAAAMSLNQSRSVSLQEKPSSREGSASCKASCRTISVQSSKTKTKDIAMSPVVPAKNSSPDGNPEEVRYKKKSNEVPSIVSQLSDKGLNPTLTGQAIKKSKPQRKKRNSSSKVLKKIECDCGDVCQCIICAPKVIEKRNAALRRRSFSCECPPQVIVVPQVMQMTCSMKTSRSAGHSQGCTCEDCRCSPCSPCPNVDKAASECRAECSEKSGSRKTDGKSKRGKSKTTIDDVFMSCKFPEMTPQTCDYQKSYAHAQDCECVDCLTLPKVKELAMTREYPIVFDEKQVYQVKVNCECVNATNAKRYVEQQRSRIPISITSPHPPRARSDHTQKLEAQTIEPKSSASEGTYKSACECQPCKCASCADPDVKKPVTPLDTQRKTCFCIGVCTCKVCPETKRAAATEVDATTAVPAPVRHTEDVKPVASSTEVDPDCDCPTCPCPFSKESRPDQHLTTHAPPAGDDCDCPLCDCPGLQKPIEEKPTVLPPMHVDVDKVPPTHVDLDKGGHPPDCNCPTCTCPGLKEISPVSDCDCPMCDCPGSPLKQPKVTEKMSERKDVVPTKPEDCTCTVCGCGDGAEVPRHHAKLLKEEGGLASCDCPSCQCVPCPDPGKERTGVPPPTAESIKPVDSCDCKECHCKPCADPKKAAKVETVAPHQRDLLEVPKKIPHPPDCECRECMCLEEIIQTELVVTLETGTQPATQPDVHAADCACPQCLCVECATKHSHPAGCRCDQCICSICDHKDKPAESFPVARHHGECSCIECRCDVCDRIQEIGLAKPSARIVHHEGCNCAECLCKECDTQLKSQLSCQCVHCLCKECLSKVKQYVRPLSQQSQRIKSTHPDGCKCLLCLCRECDEGERRALADECQCGKCICISCPKRKIGVAYAATKKELPAQVPSQLRTEPTPRAYGVKGPGCTCEQCICVECQGLMFATEKTAAPPPATISSTVSRPEDCDCQVCNCPEAKTAAPRRVTPTISKKVSHPQDCDCLVCTCTGEIGRPATPAISRMVSHPEREIIIDRPVTPKISSKISHPKDCICRVCQCPEELASRPVTPTTSRRVSHPKDCNCVVCRCPARPVTPTVSSRVPHPKGCDCLICNCLEEEEEEYISARPGTPTISKIVSHTAKDIISRPVTPKISSKVAHAKDCECPQCKHSPDCVCPGCLSLEEEIKSQRKTSSSFESAHGEDCTCPECTCEDLAAEMQIPSAAPLKRKKEEYLSAKSSEVAKPLLVLTDPPPFEAFPVPDCDCGKCDCSMCSRKAGIRKLPSSDKAKPTFTLTGPPPFEEFAEPDCKCKTCECLECTRKPGYIRLPRVPKTTEAERDVDQTARSPCDCQRCDCEVCSKTTQQLGREPKQIAAQVSSSKMSRPQTPIHCDCPTCTCDEGVLSKVEAESKTLSTISKQPSKEFFSTTSHPTETDTPRKDKAQHPADCDCPECGPCPDLFTHIPAQSSFQVPEIRKMDSVTLKQQIQAHTKENCECREEIEEIKKALNQIRCACTEAEMRTARTMMGSKPFVKQASVFGQTMSGLKMALNNLQDKCKAKDKMIAAMAGELQLRGNEEVIDKVLIMSQQMCQALDYDQAEDVKSLDRSQLVADIIYPSSDIRDQATEPCVESKSVEVRTHKRKKKLSKKVSCICSTPQIIQRDEKDCKKVDLTKFEVVDVKRITGDSLIIKWVAPGDKTITGYDIYINGTLLSKVMSGARTSAMVHSLDLSKNVHISIYAVTKCGRCDRPAIAIYKIKP